MSFFSEIKSFIKKAIGTTGTSSVSTPAVKSKIPNSVNATEITEENVDRLVITNNGNAVQRKHSLKQLRPTIETLCAQYGINFEKEIKPRLYEIMGVEEGAKLTEEQEQDCLLFIQHTIMNAKRHNIKTHKRNMSNIILSNAKHTRETIADGTFHSIEDMESNYKETGICEAEDEMLEGDLNNLTNKQMQARARRYRERIIAIQNAKISEIRRTVPKEQQAAAIQRCEDRFRALSDKSFDMVLMKADLSRAKYGLTIGGAKRIGEYSARLLDACENNEERMNLANSMDYDFYENNILKELHEQGETLDKEALAQYNTNIVAWKDAYHANAYQESYRQARERFLRGEGPEYYSEEMFKATAEGIGFGARINHVMSAAEKAEFSSNWEKDALNFGDKDVIESVNKKVETYKQEHPNEAKEIEKTEEIINRVKEKKNNVKYGTYEKTTHNTTTNPLKGEAVKHEETSTISKIQQDNKILKDIKSGKFTIQEACKNSSHAVEVILSDSNLRKEFLSDNSMVDLYKNAIKIYIKTNLHKTDEKIDFVVNNPKTLPIMISCLDNDEKEKFKNEIEGKLSYTTVKAYFNGV